MKRSYLTALLIISISLTLALVHFNIIDQPFIDARMQLHKQIIDGSAESPYRYRVLVPFVGEGLIRLLNGALGLPAWRAFSLAYVMVESGLILLMFASLFVFLRQWVSWVSSMAGILFVAMIFPLSILEQYFQPWSYLETTLLVLTLAAARTHYKVWPVALFVLLASLNRESGVFAALGFFLVTFDFNRLFAGFRQRRIDVDWRGLLAAIVPGLIWLCVFWGLRLWRGATPQIHTLLDLWALNTKPMALLNAGLNWLAFIGLLCMLAIPGLRTAPPFFKRLVWVIPIYLATVFAWGIWTEVRLLLPLYAILLVPSLLFVERVMKKEEQTN